MAKGLAIEEVEVGVLYECQLSGNKMLVIESEVPAEKVPGKEGEIIEITPARTVKAGKWSEEINGMTQYKLDEIANGQLIKIQ